MPTRINNFKLSENFNLIEFQCRCCGQVKLSPELLDKLQALRTKINKPLVITSGFRCKDHNIFVGGAQRSQHLEGTAADVILASTELDADTLADLAIGLDFRGIGLYNSFVHLDVREVPAFWDTR